MIKKLFFVMSLITFIILSCSCGKKMDEVEEHINIIGSSHSEGKIEISYPQISGIKNEELQNIINEHLKNEAFREVQNSDDLSLTIEYEISNQSNKFLSVKYIGFVNNKHAAYPRHIFTTINIDLQTGDRIQLNDIVKIDSIFVQKLRETLNSYIEKNPDWEPVYSDRLNSSDERLLNLMLESDSEKSGDCFSYLTEDYLGLSFSTSHVAGDHFEIKMMYSDIEEFIK